MPVQIQKKTVAGRGPRSSNRLMEGRATSRGPWDFLRAGEGVAVAVDLFPVEMTNDQMWPGSGATRDRFGELDREQVVSASRAVTPSSRSGMSAGSSCPRGVPR